MKKLVALGMMVLMAALLLCEAGVAQTSPKLITVNTAWMSEHELFFGWYAKEKGFDKQEGLDFKLLNFDSGMAIAEALPAKQWVLGATGGVPMVVTALRYGAYMIGVGNNESWNNAVFVRPNSPVLKTKGAQKGYPDIYGKAEDIRGKTFLVTTVSSAHIAMSMYLKAFGLKDSDVVVKQMDQASAVAAFDSGIGDFVCLWAPFTYTAEDKGWKEIANVDSSKAAVPIVFIADKEYADKNPEVVAKFLRVMFRSINKLKEEGATPENIQLFQRMYKDFAGMEYTADQAKKDIQSHPVYKLDQQLKMFDSSKGQSEVQRWELLIAEFLHANGRLKDAEFNKVKSMDWITGKYLKMVQKPIPSYK
jgi:NitT/TauT family transport system substrate-binding protein/sulfonate transport system substrate-binding protein